MRTVIPHHPSKPSTSDGNQDHAGHQIWGRKVKRPAEAKLEVYVIGKLAQDRNSSAPDQNPLGGYELPSTQLLNSYSV